MAKTENIVTNHKNYLQFLVKTDRIRKYDEERNVPMKSMRNKLSAAAVFCGILLSALVLALTGLQANAATRQEINDSSVFLKQQGSETCTLCSNVMMLRRTAMLRGDSDWNTITESAAASTLWCPGVGMYNSYTYRGITVASKSFGYDVRGELIELLREHPEGIVAYDYSYPHAVLVTDYTDGEFYVAEPANYFPAGRIRASQALIHPLNAEAYWYVVSPDVQLSGEGKTDEINVSEYWQITAESGIHLRASYSVSSASRGIIPCGQTLFVTKRVKSGGYEWGYTTYGSSTGWVALDYAKKMSEMSVTLKATASASSLQLGSSVTLKASAAGGSGPYQYAFYFKKPSVNGWSKLQTYGSSNTCVFKPQSAVNYSLLIKAKDSMGRVASQTLTVSVNKPLTNCSSVSKTEMKTGETLRLMGGAVGGDSSYQFAYYYRKPDSADWIVIEQYSTAKKVDFVPRSAAQYSFLIKVKDNKGSIAKKTFQVVVKKALTNSSSVSPLTLQKGSAAVLKGAASGGAGDYQYAYYFKKAADNDWITLKGYSKSTSATFVPSKKDTYNVMIKVKDADGAIAKKTFTLTVK